MSRRDALQRAVHVAGLLAACGLCPALAAINSRAAFDALSVDAALRALGAGSIPEESSAVTLTAPDIAENGAVVPIGVASELAGIRSLVILVEKNPSILCAVFHTSDAVLARIATRIKMDQSSAVYAVALMHDNKAFFARKEVQVSVGGCGA